MVALLGPIIPPSIPMVVCAPIRSIADHPVAIVLPFLAWAIVVLVLAIVFPPITTWLPGTVH